MKLNRLHVLIPVILFGMVVPFVPLLLVVQMFGLLISIALVFLTSLIYLIITLFTEKLNTRTALFLCSIIPVFLISQFVAVGVVDAVQRTRSERIISELENIRSSRGTVPDTYPLSGGIEYVKRTDTDHYVIMYEKGFFVTEKYDSENGQWRSYGWNN